MYKTHSPKVLKRYARIIARSQYNDLCAMFDPDKVNTVFVSSAESSLSNLRIKSNGYRQMDTDDRILKLRQDIVIASYFLEYAKQLVKGL